MSEDQEPKEDGVAATENKESSTTQSDTADSGEGKKAAEPANPAADDKAADTGDKSKEESAAAAAASKPEAGTTPIVSSSKKSRPPYKYDPDKITLRFLFANRDGLTVTVECTPADTVGEVKGALLSVWPEDLPSCSGGDQLRLVCMGKGILMPDTRTLEDCQVPVFKTHPTPINVAVRPEVSQIETSKSAGDGKQRVSSSGGNSSGAAGEQASQGCACIIL